MNSLGLKSFVHSSFLTQPLYWVIGKAKVVHQKKYGSRYNKENEKEAAAWLQVIQYCELRRKKYLAYRERNFTTNHPRPNFTTTQLLSPKACSRRARHQVQSAAQRNLPASNTIIRHDPPVPKRPLSFIRRRTHSSLTIIKSSPIPKHHCPASIDQSSFHQPNSSCQAAVRCSECTVLVSVLV